MIEGPASQSVARWLGSIGPVLLIGCVLALRCLHGLDLSDEMQYYGQVMALLDQGRLFASDLFVQQMIYVLFYPAFKAHQLIFGAEGLVVFGRALLAVSLLVLCIYVRRQLLDQGVQAWQAGCSAAALTFCVPYHGIFALSYNTVSQIAWVLFLVWYWRWPSRAGWQWALVIGVGGLAHPVAGLCMALLLLLRLLVERRWGHAGECLLWMTAGAVVTAFYVLQFAAIDEVFDSLRFSSGFAVGSYWLSNPRHLGSALVFPAALLLISWMPLRWLHHAPARALTLFVLIVGIVYLVKANQPYGYTASIFFIGAVLSALALLHLMVASGDAASGQIRWGVVGLIGHFLTLVITSSNGLGQGTGAVWLAAPLLFGMWPRPSALPTHRQAPSRRMQAWTGALLVAFFVTHWTAFPYRDRMWFTANMEVSGVEAFRFVRVSQERAQVVEALRANLSGALRERAVLIVSNYPALYFALGARPATCMLYMHSLPKGEPADAFDRCMQNRSPEAILYVFRLPHDRSALSPEVSQHVEEFARARNLTHCVAHDFTVPQSASSWPLGEKGHYQYCIRS